jgi:hypothetical protein
MSKQQPKMSRRDWFRLRSSTAKAQAQRLGADEAPNLRSIDEPVNHGGVDLSSLPPMQEALLDATDISALFSDLEQHATNVQLIARSATGSSSDHSPQLRPACDRLLAGEVRKLQIRYEWQKARWIDTIEQQPGGFRLVRIRHA